MHQSLTIARLVGPVLSAIGTVPRRTSIQLFRSPDAGRRPRHPQRAPGLDARLAQHGHRNRLWFLTGVGTFRIIAPQFANFITGTIIASAGFFTGLGIVLLALGGFITFKGYAA